MAYTAGKALLPLPMEINTSVNTGMVKDMGEGTATWPDGMVTKGMFRDAEFLE